MTYINRAKHKMQIVVFIAGIMLSAKILFAQNDPSKTNHNQPKPICSSHEKPYCDFDFVVGKWDFFTPDGTKVGEQVYTKREEGCLIVEEWTMQNGSTGMGMSFVDPKTGLWRQVWMSPMFHIDYSGGLDETGAMVLEGTIYPNNGKESSPVRGIWAKQSDGSIKQEFYTYQETTDEWKVLFAGYTRRQSE